MKPYGEQGHKDEQVRVMFDRISARYDLINRLMSLGVDRSWRRKLVKCVVADNPETILDLATGTGDLALAFARKLPYSLITGADLSEGMLEVARSKISGPSQRVTFEIAPAEKLPYDNSSFDTVSVAFGVRNFDDLEAGLSEIFRVVRPGGKVYIMEFSMPPSKFFGCLYRFYLRNVIPFVGGAVSGDREAYRYLQGSVEEFPSVNEFIAHMQKAGFVSCSVSNFTFGITSLYCGTKK